MGVRTWGVNKKGRGGGCCYVEDAADEEFLVGGEVDSRVLVDVGVFDAYGVERGCVVVDCLGLHLCAG